MSSLVSTNSDALIRYLPVAKIERNPLQPRQVFDEEEMENLVASVKEHGVLQSLLVRPVEDGFRLIAGERRWRAAQRASLITVPCIVRDVDDLTAQKLSVEENENRVDITDLDRALQLQKIWEDWEAQGKKPSVRAIALFLGKDKNWVGDRLKTLGYHSDVIEMLGRNQAVLTVAKEINAIPNPTRRAIYIAIIDAGGSRGDVLKMMEQDKQQDEEQARRDQERREAQTPPDQHTQQSQNQAATTGSATRGRGGVLVTSSNVTNAKIEIPRAVDRIVTWAQYLSPEELARLLKPLEKLLENQVR
ncbi:chromosome-partitioning protein ParB [Abditibacteriota bacterium]|nr:chromosome-partitioning protein ParB [Abditibacteriota bacterium]